MSRQTKKNGHVVNDLHKDLSNLLANLSLIDGDILLAALSSSFLSGSNSKDGLDKYLSVNSGTDHSSNFQTISQILTEPESFTEAESLDSSESGRKYLFKKKAKKRKGSPKW